MEDVEHDDSFDDSNLIDDEELRSVDPFSSDDEEIEDDIKTLSHSLLEFSPAMLADTNKSVMVTSKSISS